MKLFGFEITRSRQAPQRQRSYASAKSDRLTADWLTSGNLISDEILRWQLATLRNRARDLAMNNDYAKNFFRKLKTNVIGANSIGLQSKARLKNGELDTRSNALIEESWGKYIKKQNASVCGSLSLKDILNISIESIARDGEVLIRKHKSAEYPFAFALQILEADHLDETYNERLSNGNEVRLGIEKNPLGRPVAYHLFAKHPGDRQTATTTQRRVRVPAEEIIHAFIKERPSQSRGVPWLHTAIIRLRMVGAMDESALVAARVGASRMGFIIPAENGQEYTGDDKDAAGNIISEVEPGLIEQLPAGSQFTTFDTKYPNGEYAPFQKAMLRGIASGIGCSYNSLANDLEGVNFSSLRSGLLEERDAWKSVQTWFIEHVLEDIFEAWLPMAVLSGQLKINTDDFSRLNNPKWQPRVWEWVDPLNDIQARVEALNAGLTTRTKICAEQGMDFEDLIEQLAEEQKLMAQYGIKFEQPQKPAQGPQKQAPQNQNKYLKIIGGQHG